MTAAGEASIVRQRLGESHADARADGSCHANQERVPTFVRRECGSEDRRQRGHGAIHQTDKARLYDLQNEKLAARPLFVLLNIRAQLFFFQLLSAVFVGALLLGQVIEQLADAGVPGSSCGFLVEPAGFDFDGTSFLAHEVEAKRSRQPDRRSLDKTFYVVAAN